MSTNIGGSVSSSSCCGQDVSVQAVHSIGSDKANMAAGVFAADNTAKGPVTTGAFVAANANGHGLALQHTNTPNVGSTLTESARLNMFKGDQHSMDANAFHSHTKLTNGLQFDRVGGNVAWNHAQGHAASMGATHIPQINMTAIEAAGKANLWSSPNKATTLDLTGTASRNLSGPLARQNNFGAGLGLTHRF